MAWLAGYYIYGAPIGGMLGGTACIKDIYGLSFPFRGGKGVLTTLRTAHVRLGGGAWSSADFYCKVLLTGYVSLGSMTAALLFPIAAAVLGREAPTLIFSGLIALVIILKHHENIRRLLSGTESKFSFGKKR